MLQVTVMMPMIRSRRNSGEISPVDMAIKLHWIKPLY